MKLSLSENNNSYVINAYSTGNFTIRGQLYEGSQLVTPTDAPLCWEAKSLKDVSIESFNDFTISELEMVLLGTGASLDFPEDAVIEWFSDQNIGLEIMDTAAACRTYNLLLAEERKVLAALLSI